MVGTAGSKMARYIYMYYSTVYMYMYIVQGQHLHIVSPARASGVTCTQFVSGSKHMLGYYSNKQFID